MMRVIIVIAAVILFSGIGHADQSTIPEWIKDATDVAIPAVLAQGLAHGVSFTVESSNIQNAILKLRQGADFFADQEFMVFLFLKRGESLDGRTFSVKPTDGHGVPHIHFKYRVGGENVPKTDMFMRGYTMKLVFGTAVGKNQPGKIYLCLPDEKKSFVAGSFDAEIK